MYRVNVQIQFISSEMDMFSFFVSFLLGDFFNYCSSFFLAYYYYIVFISDDQIVWVYQCIGIDYWYVDIIYGFFDVVLGIYYFGLDWKIYFCESGDIMYFSVDY